MKVIALAASTGGTQAFETLLNLSTKVTVPMLIVQNMPPGFTKMFANKLNEDYAKEVKEAVNGEIIRENCAYIIPSNQAMRVIAEGDVYKLVSAYAEDSRDGRSIADTLFDSVAEVYKDAAVGVILTGIGQDGASGLYSMKEAGAMVIVQSEKECIATGMIDGAKFTCDGKIDFELTLEEMAAKFAEF